MNINVTGKESFIPIFIDNLEIRFDLTDEAVKNFHEQSIKIRKELNKVSLEQDEMKALDKGKQTLKKGYDLFFGEGTFNKVYSNNPSTIICMQYFEEILGKLEIQLNENGYTLNAKQKAKQYINSKKR